MIPSGWDSWGKIRVLRDEFEPTKIAQALETSLAKDADDSAPDVDGLESIWGANIPRPIGDTKVRLLVLTGRMYR